MTAKGPMEEERTLSHSETQLAPIEVACRGASFRLEEPDRLLCGAVFSSPHSGRAYFSDFVSASSLDLPTLRASEDAFVDELFRSAISLGAPLLSAIAPRAFLDLNRSPNELDPALIDGAIARPHSARVSAGLGVVPRIVAEGVSIYEHRLSYAQAEERIAHWHKPYHRELAKLLARARRTYGAALLIDCHSMPSIARMRSRNADRADVILGDRFGAAADTITIETIETAFKTAGFRVARNAPFAGGYITERFGRPAAGVNAVQIEIDRGLYMDEGSIRRSAGFYDVVDALRPVIAAICTLVRGQTALAAE